MSAWRGNLDLRDMDPFTYESIGGAVTEWQDKHGHLPPMDCFPGHLLVTVNQYLLMAKMEQAPGLRAMRFESGTEFPTFRGMDIVADLLTKAAE